MVAKINIPKDVMRALSYNERKVHKGHAECIAAGGYLRAAHQLTLEQKLRGLQDRNSLNDRATTRTLHISLNFDPSEKLSKEKLARIAAAYLDKIGFDGQPYLVYEHRDAGHPHVHIVTTTIRADGSRIPTHNIGRNQSEKARKELEAIFGLRRAESGKQQAKGERPVPQRKVYGEVETKKGITDVLTAVLSTYPFTCLSELNVILKQFGVVVDGGKERGRIRQNKGLVYRMLDGAGNKIGVPIKASSIPGKPTLAFLEKLFHQNAVQGHRLNGDRRPVNFPCWQAKEQVSLQGKKEDLQKEASIEKTIHSVIEPRQEGSSVPSELQKKEAKEKPPAFVNIKKSLLWHMVPGKTK